LPLDLEYLRRHYADLSDEGLQAIDRNGLVPAAQALYDEELARRAPRAKPLSAPRPEEEEEEAPVEELDDAEGVEPEWLEQAACVGSFVLRHGATTDERALEARDAMRAAGIPCCLVQERVVPGPSDSLPYTEYRVMVPGAQNLHAAAVMERQVFNAQTEAEWRAHFGDLSDEDFRALSLDDLCAGMRDRLERLERAYREEQERRGLTCDSRTGSPR
jgi:hypothetical protein